MSEFSPERLYVTLGNAGPKRCEKVTEAIAATGVSLTVEPHTSILNGLKKQLLELGTYRFRDVYIDTHMHELPEYTSSTLDVLQKLPSVSYISIDARDSEASIENAARFNNGLHVVMKGIDTDSTEEEMQRRFGQSIGETTESFVETAKKFGIGYMMIAGADIEHVEGLDGVFASGIRPDAKLRELGAVEDRPNRRLVDPIKVLENATVPVNLEVGRPITMAEKPAEAIYALLNLIERG